MIEERRKYIRLDTGMEFTYRIRGTKGEMKKATTKNISPGGIRSLLELEIKKGDWLELNISLPNISSGPISATGKVIWTADEKGDRVESGIKFEEIDPVMKNKFLEYICELMFSELERLRI